MTAGKNVLDASTLFVPNADASTPKFIVGGSTPAEIVEAYVFPDATTEYVDFSGRLSGDYANGGVNLSWPWSASVNTNNVVWEAAFRRIQDNTTNFTAAHTYVYQQSVSTAPSTVGMTRMVTVAFSNAQIDGLLASEPFWLRVRRVGADASDTMVGDAEMWWHMMRLYEQ